MRLRERLQLALTTSDGDALVALLANDVILNTPVVIRQFTGADVVGATLRIALATLRPIEVTDSLQSELHDTAALVFSAQVGESPLQGIWYITERDEHIASITLAIRPLPALHAFVAEMAQRGAQPAREFLQGQA